MPIPTMQPVLVFRELTGGFCFFLYVNVRFVLIPVMPGWDAGKKEEQKSDHNLCFK